MSTTSARPTRMNAQGVQDQRNAALRADASLNPVVQPRAAARPTSRQSYADHLKQEQATRAKLQPVVKELLAAMPGDDRPTQQQEQALMQMLIPFVMKTNKRMPDKVPLNVFFRMMTKDFEELAKNAKRLHQADDMRRREFYINAMARWLQSKDNDFDKLKSSRAEWFSGFHRQMNYYFHDVARRRANERAEKEQKNLEQRRRIAHAAREMSKKYYGQ